MNNEHRLRRGDSLNQESACSSSFSLLLLSSAFICVHLWLLPLPAAAAEWQTLDVPGQWEDVDDSRFADLDGFAWYRCFVKVPAEWKGQRLLLTAGHVDDVDQAFFNGRPVGAHGSPPPEYQPPSSKVRQPYVIDPDLVRFGEWNLIAWRIYDAGGRGGLERGPVQLISGDQSIDLAGTWQFRAGDRPEWSQWPAQPGTPEAAAAVEGYVASAGVHPAGHRGIRPVDEATRRATVEAAMERFKAYTHPNARVDDKGDPLPPEQALAALKPADDLAIDLVAHEPQIAQPIHVIFDERGRMWVTQYIQFPYPAGLTVVSFDEHLRAVYDKVPPPPPQNVGPFRGRDKITIHEDSDGDGFFEKTRTFVDGLNITTATALGSGGVWVLNPPYLLFYADADRDDVPDGDPVVHLNGFGLEDTHSVANSLTWGPDGWLYGASGSTTTARVKVSLNEHHPVVSYLGQAIWRYHPQRHIFEVFSEGGYNNFGVDFDDVGRVYSGTNGSPRGVHFVQEGYYKKSFGKHGPLTNPYTFGYLDAMPHTGDQTRLTHQFILIGPDDKTFPSRYSGKMLAVNSLANWVMSTRLEPWGSSFKTVDEHKVIDSTDKWFRPVQITLGPDGFAYISDWYDARITHLDPQDNWDHDRGRIYRLRAKDASPGYRPFDLSRSSSAELVGLLSHENRWFRNTALRLLADRQDRSIIPRLLQIVETGKGQAALEATWALYRLGAFDDELATNLLDHANPFVRMWAVRLIADLNREPSPPIVDRLAQLACKETDAHVRSQLASTAKRLAGEGGLRIVRGLVDRDEDADDPYLPLQLWWAVEDKAESQRREVALLLASEEAWSRKLVAETILPRLARRYAADLTSENRQALVDLIASAPAGAPKQSLIAAVLESTRGRGVDVSFLGGDAIALRLRPLVNPPSGADAITHALEFLSSADGSADAGRVAHIVRVLGDSGDQRVPSALIDLLADSPSQQVRSAAIASLGAFDAPGLPRQIVALYPKLESAADRRALIGLLSGRPQWAATMLTAVEAGTIPRSEVPAERIDLLRSSNDSSLAALVEKVFGTASRPTSTEKAAEIDRLAKLVTSGKGDPAAGKPLFTALCARCHKLHGEGLNIGPDLTIAKRDDVRELLLSIVDPSAGIHEDYTAYSLTLADGRQLIGFIVDRQGDAIKLRDLAGLDTTVATAEIRAQQALTTSVMPEGLLSVLPEQQVHDLMAYLMSGVPQSE